MFAFIIICSQLGLRYQWLISLHAGEAVSNLYVINV